MGASFDVTQVKMCSSKVGKLMVLATATFAG